MKVLTLRVLTAGVGVDPAPLVAHFDAAGGLIGRADSARLRLPDPSRTVSRFHAHVSSSDGRFYVEDMGSPNPISINGRVVQAGQHVELHAGDRIGIAHYTISVEIGDAIVAPPPSTWDDTDEGDYRTQLVVDRGRQREVAPQSMEALIAPGTQDLWQAFLEGARVRVDLPQGVRPELMRMLGTLLRSAVLALRRQLGLRLLVRREIEADTTVIRTRQNNPLKFALDDDHAVAAILKPPLPTFMSGPAAVEDAAADLESHARATIAAMRAAAHEVLSRFEPDALEARLAKPGLLESLMPNKRKALLWQLYVAQYRRICTEAQGGFDEAFNRAFALAYDAEIAKMKRPGTTAGQ
ncbi:MAG TPA: type VI secretion system-associated FHA domain protein TagH [Burkholderiaceae bacterium]|nr:type VI secretion system-associated FHA domain protein TagH [Burkholderiaceae bacterium]